MRRFKVIVFIGLLNCFAANGNAQLVRKYSNEFLSIGVSARSMAMGYTQVASVEDATAAYWNPAGLCGIDGNLQIGLMHSEYFGGIAKYDFGSVAIPLNQNAYGDGPRSYIGLSLIRFAVDDIPNTLHLIEADGSINYDNITSFSAADYGFLGSYARELIKNSTENRILRVGGNVKIIHRRVGSFARSWGFGLDAGAQYFEKNWKFGATFQDITSTFNTWKFSFSDEDKQILSLTGNEIPSTSTELTLPKLRLGAAYKFEFKTNFTILPEIGFDITTDGKRNVLIRSKPFSIDPHAGVEVGYKAKVFLRAGINNIQKSTDDSGTPITTIQPNIGIGLKLKSLQIDYALTNVGNVSEVLYSHVFSVRIDLPKKDND